MRLSFFNHNHNSDEHLHIDIHHLWDWQQTQRVSSHLHKRQYPTGGERKQFIILLWILILQVIVLASKGCANNTTSNDIVDTSVKWLRHVIRLPTFKLISLFSLLANVIFISFSDLDFLRCRVSVPSGPSIWANMASGNLSASAARLCIPAPRGWMVVIFLMFPTNKNSREDIGLYREHDLIGKIQTSLNVLAITFKMRGGQAGHKERAYKNKYHH